MIAEILTVKAKDRNSLELSLLLSPLFCKVQCLTRLITLCKMPRLNDIKLATKAETKNNLKKSHTFSIYYFFTCNLWRRIPHHTDPSCLHTTCTFPKGASSRTSLYRSKPQMPLPQEKYYIAERTLTAESSF